MTDETTSVKPLHQAYCRLTGLDLTMLMRHVFAWRAFQEHGWGEAELKLVIPMVKADIKARKTWDKALDFRNFIERDDEFAEHLARAKSQARAPKSTPRDRILAQTGHAVTQKETVRTAAQIMAEMKALEDWRKMKESLG